MQTLGLGFTWEQLSPGQRFRTLNRTITETDLVMFTGVTGMLEAIFIDGTFAAEQGAIKGRFVPAALTYSLIEGLLCQTMIQGTGLAMLALEKTGCGAGSGRRYHPRRDRGHIGAPHLEGQSGDRRVQDRRQEPERRGGDDLRSHPHAGRPRGRAGKLARRTGERMRGLTDRTVLVTGGANGIGAAVVRRLAQEGCVVGILDRDAAAGERLLAEVAADGGRASLHAADITDYDAVARAVQSFESVAGPVACLVNNAGWDRAANFLDTTPEFWRTVVGINLFGPLNVSHLVLRGMAERGFGRVVNIASDAGRVGSSGEAVYSACKGGVIAFAKTLARELVGKGIIVNTLCPGPTDTAILRSFLEGPDGTRIAEGLRRAIPMRRLGVPEDYPGLVAFLLSDDAAYITGQTISVSGGLTMHG